MIIEILGRIMSAIKTMMGRTLVTKGRGQYTYTAFFHLVEKGGYVVTCPALPGLVAGGNTLDEARQSTKDALGLYLEILREDGHPIPKDITLVNNSPESRAMYEPIKVNL